jgi:drug/metabolite transporter (DMT)-like permease
VTRWRADAALLAAALLWGGAFVAQRVAEGVVPPLGFVAARFAISALMLAPLAAFETRRAAARLDAPAWRLAIVISLTLFVGSALQQIGLATTTASNGGFLTACYVVLVPVAVWLLTGRLPRSVVAVACLLSTAGAWLLASGGGPARPMSVGDGLILISDVAWALGIALTPMFLARQPRPFTLAFIEYAICGALAAGAAAAFEPVRAADFVAGLIPLLYSGIISGGVAFTMQIVAQGYAPPAEAALILSLESLFAAVAGAILLAERLTTAAMAGCALILFSVLMVELGAPLLARLRGRAVRGPASGSRESPGAEPPARAAATLCSAPETSMSAPKSTG